MLYFPRYKIQGFKHPAKMTCIVIEGHSSASDQR